MKPITIPAVLFLLFFHSPFLFPQSAGDTYTGIAPVRSQANPVDTRWHDYYFSTEDCRCVYGDEYFVSVRETDPELKTLVITLQGGGACWPGMKDCKPMVGPEDINYANRKPGLGNMLDAISNEVFIPYCDGSVYMGDATKDYDQNGTPDHWHWGRRNSMAGINLATKKFPNAEKIILNGCSAGGYGTIYHVKLLRQAYPKAKIFVINSSGQGVFNPDNGSMELVLKTWNIEDLQPELPCENCDAQLIYNYLDVLKDPNIKIALFSSYHDQVIGQQFLKMDPEAFEHMLRNTTNRIHETFPDQFKRFFINGKMHCMRDPEYRVNGMSYAEWITAFVLEKETWADLLESPTSER